jgi:hypothetical protein
MFKYDSYDIYSYNRYFAFNYTYEFGEIANMTFAFGMASRQKRISEDYEDFGTLKAIYQSWSADSDDFIFTEITTRSCTDSDFGIETNRTDFRLFNPRQEDINQLKRAMPSLQCIDEPITIKGNFDTPEFKVLLLVFEKCNPQTRSTCKDEKELQ